jgi:hypothetical protein
MISTRSMLKMVLCSRRHPSMTRAQFFAYLTDVHAPLVLGVPEFLPYLRRYVQNHALLAEDGAKPPPSYRHAAERDSVIELFFESAEKLHEAMQVPQYVDTIRPDEGRFNDLSKLIALPTEEDTVFTDREAAPAWKMFDFLTKRADLSRDTFLVRWRRDADRLAQNAGYRALVRRRTHNVPLAARPEDFARAAHYDGVTEIWLNDLGQLGEVGNRSGEADFVDAEHSFSVIAREVPIHDATK